MKRSPSVSSRIHNRSAPGRRGFTIAELVVVFTCVAVALILVITLIVDPVPRRRRSPLMKDGTQIREIHQAMIIFAREFEGGFPRPGLIHRLPVPDLGVVPGRGEEDITQNTTANLFSVMVMQNYMEPEVLISPLERNPNVSMREGSTYNWDLYDPLSGVNWDTGFMADLSKQSHASYAHMPLFGLRDETEWKETFNSKFPVIGSRGPRGGVIDRRSYTCPKGQWRGNICYNDNHVAVENSVSPITRVVEGVEVPDNIFAMEDGPNGGDAILSFTRTMTEDGPELQHD